MTVDIEALEASAKGKTQMDFARVLTFDFNNSLVSLACNHWSCQDYEQLLRTIIDNKTLLKNKIEPIRIFFERVALKGSAVMKSTSLESIRPYIKNGIHLAVSKTLLSTDTSYVSVNEENYCLRLGPWWMSTVNKKFSDVVNSNMSELILAADSTFDLKILSKKKDVATVKSDYLTLKDGRRIVIRVVT